MFYQTKIIKSTVLLIVFISNITFVNAQYDMEWAYTYGGDGEDKAKCVVEVDDGIIVGGYAKWKDQHLWLVKLHENGLGRWGKTFPKFMESSAEDLVYTFDSKVLVAGYSIGKNDYQSDFWILKIDTAGKKIWEKHYGGDSDDKANSLIETSDSNYVIVGYSSSNLDATPNWYIIKIDSTGNLLWEKQFGDMKDDKAFGVAELYDGSFVVTGYVTTSLKNKSLAVIKLDKDGNDIWTKEYYITGEDVGTAITATTDSNFVVVGYTKIHPTFDYDAVIIKADAETGDTIWTHTWGTAGWDEATDVIETYDKSYAFAGYSKQNRILASDFVMIKYDEQGRMLWNEIFRRKSLDFATSIIETRDNGLILAGTTFTPDKGWDYAVLKLKNEERTDLLFNSPKDSIIALTDSAFNFSVCVHTIGVITRLEIYVNDTLQQIITEFPERQDSENCNYNFNLTAYLKFGKNVVKFVVVDYKKYKFDKTKVGYYFPPPEKLW